MLLAGGSRPSNAASPEALAADCLLLFTLDPPPLFALESPPLIALGCRPIACLVSTALDSPPLFALESPPLLAMGSRSIAYRVSHTTVRRCSHWSPGRLPAGCQIRSTVRCCSHGILRRCSPVGCRLPRVPRFTRTCQTRRWPSARPLMYIRLVLTRNLVQYNNSSLVWLHADPTPESKTLIVN